MNPNVATMVARYGTPLAIRKALTSLNAPVPRSDADARRALIAAAEAAAGPMVTFGFSLDAGPDASGTPRGSATASTSEPDDGAVLFDFDLECPVVRFGAPRTADVDKPDPAEGKPANKPDGTAATSGAGPNDIDLATRRALAALQAKKEALSHTVTAPGVSAAVTSGEAIRQAAEEAFWQVARERSGRAQADKVRAMIEADRRREALSMTALGRSVLADRQGADTGRR